MIYSHSFPLTESTAKNEFFVKYFRAFTGGNLAVAAFFFISGALITKSFLKNENILAFSINRLFRILPALIVSAILIALIAGPFLSTLSFNQYLTNSSVYKFIFNNLIFKTIYTLPGVFEYLPFGNSVNGSWWTLHYEILYYFILLMVGILGVFKNKNICTLLIMLCIYLIATDSKFILSFYTNPNVTFETYYLPMYFMFGAVCFLWSEYIRINKKVIISLILLTCLSRESQLYPFLLLASFFFICLWVSITPLIMKLKIKHDTSYGIYIYGFFVQQLLVYLFPSMNHNFNAIFSILICIPVGLLSAIYVEEPSVKFGKKIIARLSTNPKGNIGLHQNIKRKDLNNN